MRLVMRAGTLWLLKLVKVVKNIFMLVDAKSKDMHWIVSVIFGDNQAPKTQMYGNRYKMPISGQSHAYYKGAL
jgi:hypothetical protein